MNRIWRLCTLLRKDGVTYQQYVNELTYLIFLKMMKERQVEAALPAQCRWDRLLKAKDDLLAVYRDILTWLRTSSPAEGNLGIVFADATTIVRDQENLRALIEAIDELPWYDDGRDNFGDIYEGILERNAEESKRGAGQYFTPRVVIDAIVGAMRPASGEIVQDPAAGTGGFLIGADEFVRRTARGKRKAYKPPILTGMENVPDTHRLLLMNLMLHEIDTSGIHLGDTLSADFRKLPLADLILSNPPFGPAGRRPSREDLQFTGAVSNFQLPFVEHCLNALKVGGRAAIVVPDNVLFEEGRARDLRRYMLDVFHLHTILRLPIGIFYAAGVKTNVLFLTRPQGRKEGTTWVYDLRNNMPNFGKSTPFEQAALADFLEFFGSKSDGSDRPNVPAGEAPERFRAFTREMLAQRDDNLDLSWLRETSSSPEEQLTSPADIAGAIARHLTAAMAALDRLGEDLASGTGGGDDS
ncbi:type I restriction-modification system subunit M [Sphingomonas sp. MG17]|uniref:site-specific DNA-methyltransferase (adenine-specific) n=1 Tax=Sphingomonas tagetis TaxID=2949092 RepID=A0A9X2HLP6_9SPHN|nr:type I restriction-modification system subunit M [Sphingomonas tagetis]